MTERTPQRCDGDQEFKQPSLGSVPNSLCGVRGNGCLAAAACILGCHPDSVLTNQETDPMCHRNPWRTSRKNNKLLTHKPDCLCWKCSECRPKKKDKWIQHVTKCLQECGTAIAAITVPADRFAKFTRQLNRKDANYARVRRELDIVALVSTDNLDILNMGVQVSLFRAVELFTEMVNEIENSNGGNPISTCRAWSQTPRDHSDWELVAIGPAPAAIRSAAFLVLADFVERSINGTQVAICRGDTLQIDKLCELIGSLASGNPIAKEGYHANSDIIAYEPDLMEGLEHIPWSPYVVSELT